jgi:hypothetical protein
VERVQGLEYYLGPSDKALNDEARNIHCHRHHAVPLRKQRSSRTLPTRRFSGATGLSE